MAVCSACQGKLYISEDKKSFCKKYSVKKLQCTVCKAIVKEWIINRHNPNNIIEPDDVEWQECIRQTIKNCHKTNDYGTCQCLVRLVYRLPYNYHSEVENIAKDMNIKQKFILAIQLADYFPAF